MTSATSTTITRKRTGRLRRLSAAPEGRAAGLPTRRAVPGGLLGMVALVVAIEMFLGRHAALFTRPEGWDWRLAPGAASGRATRGEILCLGDSMIKFGVQPLVLEQRLGHRAYNLAVYSGSAPASYFLLRRTLEHGAKPRALVVDFAREILGEGPLSTTRPYPWAELVDIRGGFDLAGEVGSAGVFASTMLGRLLPSYRARLEIREYVLTAFQGRESPWPAVSEALRKNWRRNHGAQVNGKNPPAKDLVPAPEVAARFNAWRCDPVNARYLVRFLQLAAARDIPVFWLLPPQAPGYQALLDMAPDEARYVQFVRAVQGRFPNLVVVDGRHAGYALSVFNDMVHLDIQGASSLSAGLASILGRHLAGAPGPRWIDLPAYADTPSDLSP